MPLATVAIVVIFWQDFRLTYKWALKLGDSCLCTTSNASVQHPKPGGIKSGSQTAKGTDSDNCSSCSNGTPQSCSSARSIDGAGSFSSGGSISRHSSIDPRQMSSAADISLLGCLRGLCLAILTSCMVAVYIYDLVVSPLSHAVAALGSGWGPWGVWCLALLQPGWSTAVVMAAAAVLYVWRTFENPTPARVPPALDLAPYYSQEVLPGMS
ncbi:TPA: hypothetical protein ACH3X1_001575 [Trebouxia sp. C0004]